MVVHTARNAQPVITVDKTGCYWPSVSISLRQLTGEKNMLKQRRSRQGGAQQGSSANCLR
jgi:hypothetical protein